MRQRIDLGKLYRKAIKLAKDAEALPDFALPEHCPVALDDLIADEPELPALLARLG